VIDILVFIFVSFTIMFLIFKNIKLKIKYTKLITTMLTVGLDNAVLKEKLAESLDFKSATKDLRNQESEAFNNFISQSRDWAYEYIEKTQEELHIFISEVGPYIDNFDKYMDETYLPDTESMRKISNAFHKIKVLLPADYGKIE
jgi:hypothetical protein